MSEDAKKNGEHGKVMVFVHILIYILICAALSLFMFRSINDYNNSFNDNVDFIKEKSIEMIEQKNFKPRENVAARTCNLDILNDTLSMEVSYKNTNFLVEATNYSNDDVSIKFTRLDTPVESNPILLYVFCCLFSLIIVGIFIFALYIIVPLFLIVINKIITKYKLLNIKSNDKKK